MLDSMMRKKLLYTSQTGEKQVFTISRRYKAPLLHREGTYLTFSQGTKSNPVYSLRARILKTFPALKKTIKTEIFLFSCGLNLPKCGKGIIKI